MQKGFDLALCWLLFLDHFLILLKLLFLLFTLVKLSRGWQWEGSSRAYMNVTFCSLSWTYTDCCRAWMNPGDCLIIASAKRAATLIWITTFRLTKIMATPVLAAFLSNSTYV